MSIFYIEDVDKELRGGFGNLRMLLQSISHDLEDVSYLTTPATME